MAADYTEDDIKSLDWREHIRMRPGMYIGKPGDGSSPDDGLYILLKEAVDNPIDEHIMGYGKEVKVEIDEEGRVEVRDFGRGKRGRKRCLLLGICFLPEPPERAIGADRRAG